MVLDEFLNIHNFKLKYSTEGIDGIETLYYNKKYKVIVYDTVEGKTSYLLHSNTNHVLEVEPVLGDGSVNTWDKYLEFVN